MGSPKTRYRRFIASAALSVSVIVVVLLAFEVVLRTTHVFGAKVSWTMPDPILAYRFVPGSTYWFREENDHGIEGRINSHGWRDREWNTDKPRDVFRIAVLGDSFVEAFQVESDSTFLRLAEQRLHEDHRVQVELMNFGRSGCTQTEELLILQSDVIRFQPDMVIACFFAGNDIQDVRRETAPHLDRPFFGLAKDGALVLDTSFRDQRHYQLRRYANPFKRRSALVSLVLERYTLLRAARGAKKSRAEVPAPEAEAGARSLPEYLSLCTSRPDPEFARSYAFNKRLIAEMARFCKDRGISFMLMCLDTTGYSRVAERAFVAIDPTFDAFFFENDLADLAGSLGVHYVSLQTPFREADDHGRALHWVHWNYEGHRAASRALTSKLAAIVPAP